MTRPSISYNPAALAGVLAANVGFLRTVGNAVRDEARRNAQATGLAGARTAHPEQAIVAEMGADVLGPYVDVGYAKNHPGFYLWWWEVGTVDHAPRPHLRPAVRPGLL